MPTPDQKPTGSPIQDAPNGVFLSTLASMQSGQVMTDLDDAIREVVRSCTASGAKGKLTLELTVSPHGVGAGEVPLFKLEDKIKVSLPKAPRKPSIFFADGDSNLTRRHPHQEEMKLTTLEGGQAPELKPTAAPAASGA